MSGIVVYKMSGSGNDFIFVDGRTVKNVDLGADTIRQLCDRRLGVGADGFVIIRPGSSSGSVDFKFFNSDGSSAPMCGNGALCASRLAYWLEMTPTSEVALETGAGLVRTRSLNHSGQYAELAIDELEYRGKPDIDLLPNESCISYMTVGVPHLVVIVGDVEALNLSERGRQLRDHPAVEATSGANVNFFSEAADGTWFMRTYERGVEAETLACGTGAVAGAALLLQIGRIELPWEVRSASGAILAVNGKPNPGLGTLDHTTLTGEARLVFRAVVDL